MLQQAVAANDFATAQRTTAFLRNVLARVPAFREDLAAVRTPTELISEPIERFIALTPPPATPAAPDVTLTFALEPIRPSLPSLAYSRGHDAGGRQGAAADSGGRIRRGERSDRTSDAPGLPVAERQ